MVDLKINEKAVAFLSDWKTRTDKQQKTYMVLVVISFLFAFAMCTMFFYWYQNRNYDNIVENNKKYIQDTATQETNQIENEMKIGVSFVSTLVGRYVTMENIYQESTIEQRLTLIQNQTMFDRIGFVYPNGKVVSLEGTADISNRDYFIDAMNGKTGYKWLKESRISGGSAVVFYAPIEIDGEIIGVMLGLYDQERLEDVLKYKFLSYNPTIYLMLEDGTVISCSDPEETRPNMFDVLSQKKFTGDTDFDDIMDSINDTQRKVISFHYIVDGKTKVGTVSQFADSDWVVMSILPNEVTQEMLNSAEKLGRTLLIELIAVFMIVALLLILSSNRQKRHLEFEISLALENLENIISEEKVQIGIIESLVDIYSSVYFVDLENGVYKRIKENDEVSDTFPAEGTTLDGFSGYISTFVEEKFKPLMTEFLDVSTMADRLSEESSISCEYRRINKGWQRATLVVVDTTTTKPVTAVLAVQLIDKKKMAEIHTREALEQAYEAAQIASSAKTVFLSNMSHDIRTPMNAIIGMTAIAGANLENKQKVSDCLKKITSSSKHLLALINEILDMSKIESGKADLAEEEFNLSEIIENTIAINQSLIAEKKHTLTIKENDIKNENVIGDSTRLQQVFTNLLSNAVKYTPQGGKIEITVSQKPTNKPKIGYYEVSFKDNGIGMSEESKNNLFEPFVRAKDDRIAGIQGTGLGMPIARNILRMMNGDITVESEVNKGSTFTVSFTLKLQDKQTVNYASFVNLPVLVVDDDESACESTCLILNSLEMHGEYVLSGKEAVEKVLERNEKNDDYFAVILDWKMPDMNGIETTREIRKRVGKEIPIIVLTSCDWSEIEVEARNAGVTAFLSKPLFKSKVVSLFLELLGENTNFEGGTLNDEVKNHDFSGKRVLLVEDNPLNREIAIELLSMLGVETEYAENGQLGAEKFNQSSEGYYDMIFMDIQMPVMNGYEATMAIRALAHPDARKIPIVAMTANAFSTDVRKSFDAGMNGHIAKPIDIKQLIKALYDNLSKD